MNRLLRLLSRYKPFRQIVKPASPAEAPLPVYHPGRLLSPRNVLRMPRILSQSFIRERVRPVYLGDRRALCTILARYKFFVNTRDIGFATHMLTDGYWEMWLTEFMARTIKEGMFVLDVGANYGYYSVLMADLIGPAGTLIAFEPNPRAAAAAKDSLSVNGFGSRSTVLQAAVAQAEGKVPFCIPHHEPKNATMVPAGYSRADAEVIEVQTVTIDGVCRSRPRVDFIKIDAEGGEYRIYRGMEETIRRDRPMIILEFNAARSGSGDLLDLIIQTYQTLRYIGSDGLPADVSPDRLRSEKVGEDWLLLLE